MTESPERITAGKVVTFHYTLTSSDGEVVDKSDGDPMLYLHGAGNIVPGLEQQMEGKSVGAKFSAVVEPADGYGEHDPEGEFEVPRDAFPDDAPLEPGMQFAVEQPDGELVPLWVVDVDEKHVLVDRNHPLAGERLHFDVEVVAIRDATEEEKNRGHIHSGCCCGDDCGDDCGDGCGGGCEKH